MNFIKQKNIQIYFKNIIIIILNLLVTKNLKLDIYYPYHSLKSINIFKKLDNILIGGHCRYFLCLHL